MANYPTPWGSAVYKDQVFDYGASIVEMLREAGTGTSVAAGCAPFGIGTEPGGSILPPSSRCGITGLRPTFGRISRDVEDCAIIMNIIAKPDGRDLSVSDVPFGWDANMDWHKLKVGFLPEAFDDAERVDDWKKNDAVTL